MNYQVSTDNGTQVISCELTQDQIHSFNKMVWEKVQNAKSISEVCGTLEWAGTPLAKGDNQMNVTKLQNFVKHFGIENDETIDQYKQTIVRIN